MHRSALLNQNFDHRSTKKYSLQNSSFRLKSQLDIDATLPKCLKTCLNSFPNNAKGAYYRAEFKSD